MGRLAFFAQVWKRARLDGDWLAILVDVFGNWLMEGGSYR
jgi:hypothetical protein